MRRGVQSSPYTTIFQGKLYTSLEGQDKLFANWAGLSISERDTCIEIFQQAAPAGLSVVILLNAAYLIIRLPEKERERFRLPGLSAKSPRRKRQERRKQISEMYARFNTIVETGTFTHVI